MLEEFQFHYGTIKRDGNRDKKTAVILFQFHYGTIKRNVTCSTSAALAISIPLWYD